MTHATTYTGDVMIVTRVCMWIRHLHMHSNENDHIADEANSSVGAE